MSKYRTAMGKTVDMATLAAKNEKIRAVGNMSVNARGDTIDAHGKIVKPATQKVSDSYQKTVGNRSANVVKQPVVNKPATRELTADELELEQSLEDDIEVEQIKANEQAKTKRSKK
jgi:hypothetical protein